MAVSSATLHESNARNDIKCIELRAAHGPAGYGIYWMLIEMLREASGHRLPLEQLPAIAYGLAIDKGQLTEVFETCHGTGLFVADDSYFWSDSLCRRMERIDQVSQARQVTGKIGGLSRGKQLLSKPEPIAKTPRSKGLGTVNKIKLNKREIGMQGEESFPEALDHPACRAAWERWLAYKADRKENYKGKSGAWLVLSAAAKYGPDAFCWAIEKSMGAGWAGMFPDKYSSDRAIPHQIQAPKPSKPKIPDLATVPSPSDEDIQKNILLVKGQLDSLLRPYAPTSGGET